ncbi:hypothetical protein M3Y94_00902700 [Aphelenchoides besseyi]|nr:hypothetical protein M3Y94_00902700 [Aphelenchoides besseyi]KAI6223337.1 hypothetical protein M3Y95_00879400 [Aphelenchoides besseyi]
MSVARFLFVGVLLLVCVRVDAGTPAKIDLVGQLLCGDHPTDEATVVFYEKDPMSNDLCGVAKVNASGYFKAHVVENDGGGGMPDELIYYVVHKCGGLKNWKCMSRQLSPSIWTANLSSTDVHAIAPIDLLDEKSSSCNGYVLKASQKNEYTPDECE